MEEILSSIKRIIADEGETATGARTRRAVRSPAEPGSFGHDEILELSDPVRREPVPAATPTAIATTATVVMILHFFFMIYCPPVCIFFGFYNSTSAAIAGRVACALNDSQQIISSPAVASTK